MPGTLLNNAIKDLKRHIGVDFNTELLLITNNDEEIEINGYAAVHSTGFDENGVPIIADNSYILFSEVDVNVLGYTTRVNRKVDLRGWKVQFSHAVGEVSASLAEPQPDSTFGVIRVMIRNYN